MEKARILPTPRSVVAVGFHRDSFACSRQTPDINHRFQSNIDRSYRFFVRIEDNQNTLLAVKIKKREESDLDRIVLIALTGIFTEISGFASLKT